MQRSEMDRTCEGPARSSRARLSSMAVESLFGPVGRRRCKQRPSKRTMQNPPYFQPFCVTLGNFARDRLSRMFHVEPCRPPLLDRPSPLPSQPTPSSTPVSKSLRHFSVTISRLFGTLPQPFMRHGKIPRSFTDEICRRRARLPPKILPRMY